MAYVARVGHGPAKMHIAHVAYPFFFEKGNLQRECKELDEWSGHIGAIALTLHLPTRIIIKTGGLTQPPSGETAYPLHA